MKNNKNIMVDMSATIIHHGHIRLLKKASKFGKVIVALSNDEDIKKFKNITPEIKFKYRKEILQSIVYVDQVVKSPWLINESFLKKYKINYLVHGEDNANPIIKKKLKIFQKTKNISSNLIRRKACKNISLK
tara:strand:- start:128 stop:523 length:396 start_codon:yes stop_codon:yes gene_type:complete